MYNFQQLMQQIVPQINEVTPDVLTTPYKDLGVSSVQIIALMAGIEQQIGTKVFDVSNMAEVTTLDQICRIADQKSE